MQSSAPILILGIDPGYDRLGICVLEKKSHTSKEKVLHSDCITSDKKEPFEKRLYTVCAEIESQLAEFPITAIALEKVFFQKNQKTATKVAEIRGALMYIAQKNSIPLFEYTPNQIKVATTGDGRGDKTAMMHMITRMLILPSKKRTDDEFDAIGIALTCMVSERW